MTDNSNTHAIASLYETYPAQEAKRIRDKLEPRYTPKHGTRLNTAEIELSVINRQGLPARVGTLEEMRERTRAWTEVRNGKGSNINRRFTTADARIKRKRLYPSFGS